MGSVGGLVLLWDTHQIEVFKILKGKFTLYVLYKFKDPKVFLGVCVRVCVCVEKDLLWTEIGEV